jgi:hypothetical protein
MWLAGRCERANRRQCPFFAKTAQAISIQIRLCVSIDVITIRQSLRCLRSRDRAKWRSLHYFSAMQSPAKAEQLNVIFKEGAALADSESATFASGDCLNRDRTSLASLADHAFRHHYRK